MNNYLKVRYPLLLILLTTLSLKIFSQDTLVFGYDYNGNRISRTLRVYESRFVNFPINQKELDNLNSDEVKGGEETKGQEELNEIKTSIKIYPNPTTGIIKISIENYPESITGKYQVYTLTGTIEKENRISIPITEINMNSLTNGIYILRITINDTPLDYKIIKHD
jgi:hypothetical protein